MVKDYFTEDQKLVKFEKKPWSYDEQILIRDILQDKGYSCNMVYRIGADREMHEALEVERSDVPRLIEQFFRQRIVAEYEANGKGKASIIFSYDYYAETIIDAVNRFWKNKEGEFVNGGVLSDGDIKNRVKELFKDTIAEEDIQPASIDLHLASDLLKLDGTEYDLSDDDYILEPGEFILGSTSEYVTVPGDLVAQVDGKSSIGRLGIDIHKTAGWIDSCFNGRITLEIKNDSDKAFILSEGMCICQIVFMSLTRPCEKGYGHPDRNNHYQDSDRTILSKL